MPKPQALTCIVLQASNLPTHSVGNAMKSTKHLIDPTHVRAAIGTTSRHPQLARERCILSQHSVTLHGWPAHGGLIVPTSHGSRCRVPRSKPLIPPPVAMPTKTPSMSSANSSYCWARNGLIVTRAGVHLENDQSSIGEIDDGDVEAPTKMESRWMIERGRRWAYVAEFDTVGRGMREEDDLLPGGAARREYS